MLIISYMVFNQWLILGNALIINSSKSVIFQICEREKYCHQLFALEYELIWATGYGN
jgi:hypothetical protein